MAFLAMSVIPDLGPYYEVSSDEISAFSAGYTPSQKAEQTYCCYPGKLEDTVAYGARCVAGTQVCAPNVCPDGTQECVKEE